MSIGKPTRMKNRAKDCESRVLCMVEAIAGTQPSLPCCERMQAVTRKAQAIEQSIGYRPGWNFVRQYLRRWRQRGALREVRTQYASGA